MATVTMGIGGGGGFISQPLAIVVIGGLLSSTILTLVVLPTLYVAVEGARERRAARKAERARSHKHAAVEPEPETPRDIADSFGG